MASDCLFVCSSQYLIWFSFSLTWSWSLVFSFSLWLIKISKCTIIVSVEKLYESSCKQQLSCKVIYLALNASSTWKKTSLTVILLRVKNRLVKGIIIELSGIILRDVPEEITQGHFHRLFNALTCKQLILCWFIWGDNLSLLMLRLLSSKNLVCWCITKNLTWSYLILLLMLL